MSQTTVFYPRVSEYMPFVFALARVENSIRSGFREGKWFPHRSLEGGKATIAYGHKLKDGEDFTQGITEYQAIELFKKDIEHAEKVAKIQWNDSQTTDWFELNIIYRCVLVDLVYNIGTLKNSTGGWGWPKLARAIVGQDNPRVRQEALRSYLNPVTGERVQLTKRRDDICDVLGIR